MRPKVKNLTPGDLSLAVKELRESLDMTQQQFATKMNTALTTIARWETVRPPRARSLLELARLAAKASKPELAAQFKAALGMEAGAMVRAGYRATVTAAVSKELGFKDLDIQGLKTLRSGLVELWTLSGVLALSDVPREDVQRAGEAMRRVLADIADLLLENGARSLVAEEPVPSPVSAKRRIRVVRKRR